MEEEKGAWAFDPVPAAAAKGWSTRPWAFTPRAVPAIFFGGRVAGEQSNLLYMFGMVDGEKPVEKVLMALSLDATTFQDSVIGARTLVHIKDFIKVDAVLGNGGCATNARESKSCLFWNPKT